MNFDDPIAALEHLIELAERGELKTAAIRLKMLDGTEQEVVIGGTEGDRGAVLAKLRRLLGELH